MLPRCEEKDSLSTLNHLFKDKMIVIFEEIIVCTSVVALLVLNVKNRIRANYINALWTDMTVQKN